MLKNVCIKAGLAAAAVGGKHESGNSGRERREEEREEREEGKEGGAPSVIHDGAGAIYVEKTLMQKYGDAFLSKRKEGGKRKISAFLAVVQ